MFSVFDTSTHSGNILALLEALAKRGHTVSTITGGIFTHVSPPDLLLALERLDFVASQKDSSLFERMDTTGFHRIQLNEGLASGGQNQIDLVTLVNKLLTLIHNENPDIVLYSTDSPDSHSLLTAFSSVFDRMVLCEDANIRIENVQPTKVRKIVFGPADNIQGDNSDTMYLPHLLPTKPKRNMGSNRQKITFVGPSPENGFGPFLHLYQNMHAALPHQRFFIVQNAGEIEKLDAQNDLSLRELRKLELLVHPWFDFDFLETSSALVIFNPDGRGQVRLVLEAMARGVPVFASNVPVFADLLGDAGNLFTSPLIDTKAGPVTTILPWTLALSELATDEEFREVQSETMQKIAAGRSAAAIVDRTEGWLENQTSDLGPLA